MKVLSYDECAKLAGVCRRSIEREIADGKGPPVIHITSRRRGILEDDFNDWLLSRRGPVFARAPQSATVSRAVSGAA